MKAKPIAGLPADLKRQDAIRRYNEMIQAYGISGNGLLPWLALMHCREEGIQVPDDLIAWLADAGAALWRAAARKPTDAAAYAKALQLPHGARELTAAQQTRNAMNRVRRVAQAMQLMELFAISAPDACARIARDKPSAATLEKDYYTLRERPAKKKATEPTAQAAAAPVGAAWPAYRRPPRR
jgi:hypothetical protein